MKKLTRLLLINWHYFQNTIIDFGTINFLTGKNSSGKSTIIDALQVVLMRFWIMCTENDTANTNVCIDIHLLIIIIYLLSNLVNSYLSCADNL